MVDYDAFYSGQQESETLSRIYRDVYGDDYPGEAEPACFVTKTDLVRMAQCLSMGPGETLADLGCGRGGPGLWLARELGADLVGVDLSREAIRQASQRITHFGLEGRARFIVADMCATTLEDESCDGAVNVDALFAPDKTAAVLEVDRVLRSGARFVLTWWETAEQDEVYYRGLLQDGGFLVEEYTEKPDWRRRQLAVHDGILVEQAALMEEMGEAAAGRLIEGAEGFRSWMADRRHVFIVGRKV